MIDLKSIPEIIKQLTKMNRFTAALLIISVTFVAILWLIVSKLDGTDLILGMLTVAILLPMFGIIALLIVADLESTSNCQRDEGTDDRHQAQMKRNYDSDSD